MTRCVVHVPLRGFEELIFGIKNISMKTALLAFAAGFEICSELTAEMRLEIADWDEGRRVCIGVLPEGPYITVEKRAGLITYVGQGRREADITILFKNMDSALLVFTGQTGSADIAGEFRIRVEGSNARAMELTRAMTVVQTYLFPSMILRKTLKRVPAFDAARLGLKARVMGLLPARMAMIASR